MVSQRGFVQGIATGLWSQRLLRIVIGALFFYAGYAKLSHVDKVAENLLLLDIFPWGVINVFAAWMLCFEMCLGVLLIAGVWLRACSGMLVVFCLMCLGLISFAIASDLKMHCGCFVTAPTGPARSWASLGQELFVLIGCVWLLATTTSTAREPRGEDSSKLDSASRQSLQASG